MGKVIFVTAFKGGVGKTTVTAGLAASLAMLGKRVCVVDADFGMRCMDLVLGMESSSLYDCSDILLGRCTCEDAILPVTGRDNLYFLSAPMRYDGSALPRERADALFAYLRENYDICLVDSSAELSAYYRLFASQADEAIVVSLHQSTAIRAAEKTAANLASIGLTRIRLIINGYRDAYAASGALPSILDMILRSSVPLLGVLPMADDLPASQERGDPAFGDAKRRKLKPYEAAFLNISLRLYNENVPLLQGVTRPGRRAGRIASVKKRITEVS